MKVLHVIPSVASVRGGPSQAVLEMVRALRHLNIDAEIATTNDNGDGVLDIPLHQKIEYQEIPSYFFANFSAKTLPRYAIPYRFIPWLLNHGKEYDLLHIHGIFSCLSSLTMAIGRIKKFPYIVRPLGQLCTWSMEQGARKKQLYLNLVEKNNINHSQAIHLTSEQERKELSLLNFKTKNFILPHGLSLPPLINNARQKLRCHFNLPEDEIIIIFMSRLHEKKGLEYLIPALSALKNHKFTLIIAGSGTPEYEKKINKVLVDYEIKNRTICPGFVNGDLKKLLLQGSDLFTLTSHSENFGIVVLEALAVGLPVIVTPGVALSSIIKDYDLGYVPELNINSITQSFKDFFEHYQERKNFKQRARNLIIEQYSWDSIANQLASIYQQAKYSTITSSI